MIDKQSTDTDCVLDDTAEVTNKPVISARVMRRIANNLASLIPDKKTNFTPSKKLAKAKKKKANKNKKLNRCK